MKENISRPSFGQTAWVALYFHLNKEKKMIKQKPALLDPIRTNMIYPVGLVLLCASAYFTCYEDNGAFLVCGGIDDVMDPDGRIALFRAGRGGENSTVE